jgi:hypothetical protein
MNRLDNGSALADRKRNALATFRNVILVEEQRAILGDKIREHAGEHPTIKA